MKASIVVAPEGRTAHFTLDMKTTLCGYKVHLHDWHTIPPKSYENSRQCLSCKRKKARLKLEGVISEV